MTAEQEPSFRKQLAYGIRFVLCVPFFIVGMVLLSIAGFTREGDATAWLP